MPFVGYLEVKLLNSQKGEQKASLSLQNLFDHLKVYINIYVIRLHIHGSPKCKHFRKNKK